MTLVGLDCATQPKHTGLAVATLDGGAVRVREARIARSRDDLVRALVGWLAPRPAVLALDAPLGWPAPMRRLATHRAGEPIETPPNAFFRRETDRHVQRTLGKTPLDVGADRIARTAHAALATLAAVRQLVPVDLGWTPGAVEGVQAIEVYPAATLLSRRLSPRGYKRADARERRAEILDELAIHGPPRVLDAARDADHVLDAILCCVAASDYALGHVTPPPSDERVRREGWIWVRPPEAPGLLTPPAAAPGETGGRP